MGSRIRLCRRYPVRLCSVAADCRFLVSPRLQIASEALVVLLSDDLTPYDCSSRCVSRKYTSMRLWEYFWRIAVVIVLLSSSCCSHLFCPSRVDASWAGVCSLYAFVCWVRLTMQKRYALWLWPNSFPCSWHHIYESDSKFADVMSFFYIIYSYQLSHDPSDKLCPTTVIDLLGFSHGGCSENVDLFDFGIINSPNSWRDYVMTLTQADKIMLNHADSGCHGVVI